MDEADRADEVYELSLRHAVFMARNSGPLAGSSATGACLLCDEVISEPGRRWCGAVCRDGWEKVQQRA